MAPLIEEKQEPGTLVSAALRDKAMRALSALPPFSPVLNRLLASMAGEDVSFLKLADLIEKDTVVAGNVLQLVNSAQYGRRGTISSVRHALSLLGMDKLRNAVLGMSITRMWHGVQPAGSWPMARFNLHSAATAMLSDMLAQRVPAEYPEGAYVAGLMHDVGRLLIAAGLPGEHDRIADHHRAGGRPIAESEFAVLGFAHPELSGRAVAYWKLPEPIQRAVRDHHASFETNPSGQWPLGGLVAAADQYVHSVGVSILPQSGPGAGSAEAGANAFEGLGLDARATDILLDEFRGEFDAMMPFFR